MQVQFGNSTMTFDSAQLGELRDANALLDSPEQLHDRMDEDGYLLLRGLIDRDKVLAARRRILEYMAEREAMEPGSRPLEGVMGEQGKPVNMMGKKAITHEPVVRNVLEAQELFDFYNRYFDEQPRTFDYKWLRAVGHESFTGVHYDVVYMGRGSGRLLTCWIPFGDIDIEQGTLAICPGSHRLESFQKLRDTYGRVDVDRDRVTGWFSQDPQEIIDKFGSQWQTTRFRAGDVITFGMYTLHASTTNTTDRWRLSCDVRFQPGSDPVDERWVGENPINHYALAENNGQDLRLVASLREQWGV